MSVRVCVCGCVSLRGRVWTVGSRIRARVVGLMVCLVAGSLVGGWLLLWCWLLCDGVIVVVCVGLHCCDCVGVEVWVGVAVCAVVSERVRCCPCVCMCESVSV